MADRVDVEFVGGGPADGKIHRLDPFDALEVGAEFLWKEGGECWTYVAEMKDEPVRCCFRFKDEHCGYRGAETECDKTFARCHALGNVRRFGGIPGERRQRWVLRLKRPGKAKA
jgi:hypothetical protein